MGKVIVNSDLNSSSSDEDIQKSNEYVNYILEHVNNVKTAYNTLFKNKVYDISDICSQEEYECSINLLDAGQGIIAHDDSKFSDEEFYGYRRKFYPTSEESAITDLDTVNRINEDYEAAWKHHYTHNPHHPKYWKYTDEDNNILDTPLEVARPMDMRYIIEMICDWEGMSIKFKSSTVDWYNNKATEEKKDLNPATKNTVEKLLRQIYNKEIL